MKRKVLAGVFIIILITVIFAGTYLYNNLGSDKYVTVTVQNLTDTEAVTGYVVKNEKVIDLSGGKFVRFYCEEGDKVSSGSYIASVYDNEKDGNLLSEIDAIDSKLENISDEYVKLTMNDVVKIETYIDEDVDEYSYAVDNGNLGNMSLIKGRLTALFNIKHSGKSSTENEESRLKSERRELESRLSTDKSDVESPMGGIFSSETDGLEGAIDFERAKTITVGEFDEIMDVRSKKDSKSCKIVDNYQWLLMCKVPSDYATVTEKGSRVTIELPDGEEIQGKVEYVSMAEKGKCIVTISSDRDFNDLGKARKIDVTITFNKYTGYVIPTEAFHMYENEYGVFVETGNRLSFKATEIIYSNEEYTVVRPSGKTELKLYDNVVVKGDLSEFYD